jgi:hypothetical protein
MDILGLFTYVKPISGMHAYLKQGEFSEILCFGFCPSSCIKKKTESTTFWKLDVSTLGCLYLRVKWHVIMNYISVICFIYVVHESTYIHIDI